MWAAAGPRRIAQGAFVYYALEYEVVDDYVERRKPFRSEHLALAEEAARDGRLVLAGAYAPADGALLVFEVPSAADVEAFVQRDPYVKNGLVKRWRVREWTVVAGSRK
jgi:uncharacterized protein YciI